MFTASDNSTGWCPPNEPPPPPMADPMSIEVDEGSFPMLESPVCARSDIWAEPGVLPSPEWDPPAFQLTSTPGCGDVASTPIPQTLSDSSSNTDTSEDNQGWIPLPLPPSQTFPEVSPSPTADANSSPQLSTPIHRTSHDSSNTDALKDSEGWTPPTQPALYIPLTLPMSVLSIQSTPSKSPCRSTSLAVSPLFSGTGEPTESGSNTEARCFEDSLPRVIGMSPIAHHRLVNKGKARETESGLVSRFPATCPKDVEG